MINAAKVLEMTKEIQELSEAADKQESKELLNFHGWMKDFKPGRYLKSLKTRINKLHSSLEAMAKKANAAEWDAMIKAQNICPEIYCHESMTEY